MKNYLMHYQRGIDIIQKNKYSATPITVKTTDEMDEKIKYLEKKLLLNPTAVMRYCLARVYEEEINKNRTKEQKLNDDVKKTLSQLNESINWLVYVLDNKEIK